MYKTVRQGDASLHYTIVPQNDQLYVNEMSSVLESSESSPVKNKIDQSSILESPYLTAFEAKYLVLRFAGFFISCLISVCLIVQAASCNSHCRSIGPIANKNLTLSNRPDKNYEIRQDFKASTPNNMEILRSLNDHEIKVDSIKTSTSGSTRDQQESSNFEIALDETTLSPTHETPTRSYSASTESTSKETMDVTSNVSEESSIDRSSVIGARTSRIVDVLKKLKTFEMPRIVLKLRTDDDNNPQTYEEAGKASYKKGQIASNVPAQGLSLEGLIFNTAEGTIKSWTDKQPSTNGSVIILNRFSGKTFEYTIRTIILIFLAMILLWLVMDISRSPPFRPSRSWYSIEKIDAENPN